MILEYKEKREKDGGGRSQKARRWVRVRIRFRGRIRSRFRIGPATGRRSVGPQPPDAGIVVHFERSTTMTTSKRAFLLLAAGLCHPGFWLPAGHRQPTSRPVQGEGRTLAY